MKIVTVYPYFINKGGAQNMAISIAKGLSEGEKPVVLVLDNRINEAYNDSDVNFKKLNLLTIYNYYKKCYVFLSHHRKTTTYLELLSRFFFWNKLKVVHVAHNTFDSLRMFTLFPKFNIAVSETVKDNMIQYFGLKEDSVRVIYNGIVDKYEENKAGKIHRVSEASINILFLGRIDPVKRQVDFVRNTKGKLSDNIKIYFAGLGQDYETLRNTIQNDSHYVMLGLVNPYEEIYKYDYVCLFSEKEGLPLTLIEALMFKKPLITNDIPQCLEINEDGYCGYVNHSYDDILKCLNNLPSPDSELYKTLSANARSIYENKFQWGVMIRNYFESIS